MLATRIAVQIVLQIRLGTADDRDTCTLLLAEVGTLRQFEVRAQK